MKIERINENQIKIVLSRADLAARNLNINELAYNNEKMQSLFREMMEQAFAEHSFRPENSASLMIEAALVSSDSVMIIVTKVNAGDERQEIIDLIPKTKDERMFRKKPIPDAPAPPEVKTDGLSVYSFAEIDDVIKASSRLRGRAPVDNALYKYAEKYYLVIRTDADNSHISADLMDGMLGEYGQRQYGSTISEFFLKEHGETIIPKNAMGKLGSIE